MSQRLVRWFAKNWTAAIRTSEGATILALVLTALGFGGDMLVAGCLLAAAWIVAAVGIGTAQELSRPHKLGLTIAAAAGFVLLGGLIWHHNQKEGALDLTPAQEQTIKSYAVAPNGREYIVLIVADGLCKKCEEFSRNLRRAFGGMPGWAFVPAQAFGMAGLNRGVVFIVGGESKQIEAAGLMERAFQAASVPFTPKQGNISNAWVAPDLVIEVNEP